jgi:hypothetical protein
VDCTVGFEDGRDVDKGTTRCSMERSWIGH